MQTNLTKTVREIAVENPSSIRVFESLGIDYCCGGAKSIDVACLSAGINTDHLLQMLQQARLDAEDRPLREWTSRTLRELTTHIIENHHGYIRREMPRITALFEKVNLKHGEAHPELFDIEKLFTTIRQELLTHILKEEQILFPYIERMEQAAFRNELLPPAFFGSVANPIAHMLSEHDDAGALMAEIRKLTDGYKAPAGVCPTFLGLYRSLEEFERDLHLHVHLENNILFPRAIEMERDFTQVAR
jgi:regulator of cell morphogenesis and NO signaling